MSEDIGRLAAELAALSGEELAAVLAQAGLGRLVHRPRRLLVPAGEFEKHRVFLEQGGVTYDHGRPGRQVVGHIVLPEGTLAWPAPVVQVPGGRKFMVATVGSTSRRLIVPLEDASP